MGIPNEKGDNESNAAEQAMMEFSFEKVVRDENQCKSQAKVQ
jgi:hypothetical protein